MRIANPIYDAVFNSFKEDPEMAKRLLNNIIEQEVVSLVAQQQEALAQSKIYPNSVLGLDFQALQQEIRAEQYIDNILAGKDKMIAKQQQILVEKDQTLLEKDQALVEKDQALVEKDQALVEKDQALAQAEQQKITTAKNFIALGLPVDAVASAMQVTTEDVERWLKI